MPAPTAELQAIVANLQLISTGITNLDNQIQAFQNSPGTLSASDQALLDSISSQSAALATAANAVVAAPATPVSPLPTPSTP